MSALSYSGYRFPRDIIQRAVWMYLRFTLSFRDVEELLAERGIVVTYESIRRWVLTFAPAISRKLRARRPKPHGRWHLDEMVVRISGKQMYLWRAVDAEGEILDVLLQTKRDRRAARKLMRKLLKRHGLVPDEWVTDKNPAYGAALRELKLTGAPHTRRKRANSRAESSHAPVRRRERKLQGFKSPGRPSDSCPCMQPPTTPSPFLVISFLLVRTGSFELRRSRHGGTRLASMPDTGSCAASRGHMRQVDKATRSSADGGLQRWGLKLRERVGFKRAAVALARKLAVTMHAMLKAGTFFDRTVGAAA